VLWPEEHYQYSMWALDTGEDTLNDGLPNGPTGANRPSEEGLLPTRNITPLGEGDVIAETNGTLVTRSSVVIEL
jgi:hypothetical protein